MNSALAYELRKTDARARLGKVTTQHGSFDTPAFMPVGTQGSVKGLLPEQLAAAGAQCILANTYHLMLRPGAEVIAGLGDLHGFMGWPGPILTDSGGFQVFSLSEINRISDSGVTFRSHIDGARVELTPARSIEVQNALGADIIMAFDECPPGIAPRKYHVEAVERTLRWAAECAQAHQRRAEQSLFGIVQGGVHQDLRTACAEKLVAMDLPGYAVGGLAVGEGFEAMLKVLDFTTPLLPAGRPRYLMGVGFPRDIVAAVAAGIDMFDCVMPTRNGRNAYAFTAAGPVRLRNAKYTRDARPLEENCDCYACKHFPRGAIRHFFFAAEMLGPVLVSMHNMRFYQRLMADIRRAIAEGTFESFRREDTRCRLGPAGKNPAIRSQLDRQYRTTAETAPGSPDSPQGDALIHAFVLLAQAATKATTPTTGGKPPWWTTFFDSMLWPMALVLAVFYFLMIRSKRTQDKQVKDMLSNLKKGDRVQTIGGILGTVVEAREDEVLVKVDESANAKIRFVRKAIHRVVESDRTGGSKSSS